MNRKLDRCLLLVQHRAEGFMVQTRVVWADGGPMLGMKQALGSYHENIGTEAPFIDKSNL